VVKEYNPNTCYWPSSPSSGGAFDDPNDENRGMCIVEMCGMATDGLRNTINPVFDMCRNSVSSPFRP
jgi:beta-mannosidase